MSDFKWSPEAIEAADIAVSEGVSVGDVNLGRDAIYAAVKVQPVVALPPCPTCKGQKKVHRVGVPGYEPERHVKCPACNGSGVERLVPVSEILAWLRTNGRHYATAIGLRNAIEREFGGRDE